MKPDEYIVVARPVTKLELFFFCRLRPDEKARDGDTYDDLSTHIGSAWYGKSQLDMIARYPDQKEHYQKLGIYRECRHPSNIHLRLDHGSANL